ATAGGNGTAGGTAGGSATAGGNGGGTAGGAVMLHYSSLAIPSTSGSYIAGISGRAGEIYAISDATDGLFRSTGGGFSAIVGSGLAYGRSIYVASDGSVFPAGQRMLGVCRSNCAMPTSYTYTMLGFGNDV